ncbi:MAG: hypothetical protein PVI07_17725 [Anaerolineae bacterium]|jgi:hypothetical protein
MSPEHAAAEMTLFGIVRDPRLMESMVGLPLLTRQKIDDEITGLQFNPRPPQSTAMTMSGMCILRKPVLVDEQQRKYHLVYLVDDEGEKVFVIALERFSQ